MVGTELSFEDRFGSSVIGSGKFEKNWSLLATGLARQVFIALFSILVLVEGVFVSFVGAHFLCQIGVNFSQVVILSFGHLQKKNAFVSEKNRDTKRVACSITLSLLSHILYFKFIHFFQNRRFQKPVF